MGRDKDRLEGKTGKPSRNSEDLAAELNDERVFQNNNRTHAKTCQFTAKTDYFVIEKCV